MKEYFFDVGSSTIKFYCLENEDLKLIDENSIHFKDDFSFDKGISEVNKNLLVGYFSGLIKDYGLNDKNCSVFATGIFRKFNDAVLMEFITWFKEQTGLLFHVISEVEENVYLEKALENDYAGKKIMVINMGGKSTELVTFQNNIVTDRSNIDLGVGDLITKFPEANEEIANIDIDKVIKFAEKHMKLKVEPDYDGAIFTGGELRFEKLTGYNLVPNTIFDDGIHKEMVSYKNYMDQTKKVFFEMTIQDLYNLMPSNPRWMDGARLGALLPVPIFKACGVKWIIPSDLNLIHGVIKSR